MSLSYRDFTEIIVWFYLREISGFIPTKNIQGQTQTSPVQNKDLQCVHNDWFTGAGYRQAQKYL